MAITGTVVTTSSADYAIVGICNIALVEGLGANPILSLTDDSKQARTMSTLFANCRDSELSAHDWVFAIKRDTLSPLTSVPDFEYDYQYQVPSDCLRIIQCGEYFPGLGNFNDVMFSTAEYKREDDKILTNDYPTEMPIRYIYRHLNPIAWPALFKQVLAFRLAIAAAEAMTQNTSKRESLKESYITAIKIAKRANAIEQAYDALPNTAWLEARK